jgi:hypothetical protein
VGGEDMSPQDFLQADRRWAVWGCHSHEQYLEKYSVTGKFHSAVPEKVKEAYHTVERLIAYSYFYYPMTEEAWSKLTRIFEMSIRNRAQQLGIATDKTTKTGRCIPENLGALINKLKIHPASHQEWVDEWMNVKTQRNLHAHPMEPNYGGPINLMMVVPMINVINSVFIDKEWFNAARERVRALQERAHFYSKGVYVLDLSGRRLIVTRAIPAVVSHDEKRSVWIMEPVGLQFPQTMGEYFSFDPILLRLTDICINKKFLKATDYLNNQKVVVTPSDHPSDLEYTKNYLRQMNTAEQKVLRVYNHNFIYHLYTERERFIYDEFWESEPHKAFVTD